MLHSRIDILHGRPQWAPLLLIVALCLVAPPAGSSVFSSERDVRITNLHRIEDDVYASGNNITVDGYIGGDLCMIAQQVTTSGEVAASENAIAINYTHSGRTDGALRAVALESTIDGYIGRSLILIGFVNRVSSGAVIRRDLTAKSAEFEFAGRLMGNLKVQARSIRISGTIDGDADLRGEKIVVVPPAVIKGSIAYSSDKEIEIDTAGGVVVLGDIVRDYPDLLPGEEEEENQLEAVLFFGARLAASFLLGLILMYLFKRYSLETVSQMKQRPAVAGAAGFLSLLVGVVAILVLLLSLVLLISGMSLLSSEVAAVGAMLLVMSILAIPITTLAGISSGTLLYLGTIALAPAVGYLVVRLVKRQPAPVSKSQLIIGLTIIALLSLVPYVGILCHIVASLLGAGGIILGIRNCRHGLNGPTTGNTGTSGQVL